MGESVGEKYGVRKCIGKEGELHIEKEIEC